MNMNTDMDPMKQERDLNQWLESALSQYGKTEPRTGLESRVLATLQAERNRIASRRRWWWAMGTAAATAALALVVWLGHADRARNRNGIDAAARHDARDTHRSSPTLDQDVPSARQQAASGQVVGQLASNEQLARKGLRRPSTPRPVRTSEGADAPRLEQFPAPAPLSDQEQLLARYVRQFPHRAVLMARAQTDLRKRTELEMAAPWPKNTD